MRHLLNFKLCRVEIKRLNTKPLKCRMEFFGSLIVLKTQKLENTACQE